MIASEGMAPVFDARFYRAQNPDLALQNDEAARAHYEAEGRSAGRIASPMAVREGLLAFLKSRSGRVLEIGPFCRPLLTGSNVDYLDVLDVPQLRERAKRIGLDPAGCPETIRFVGELTQVNETYDIVVSSHVIEHQPDLVRHLNEVARTLKPGGLFALIVPDKRFCFDHFIPESTIAAVMAAHYEARSVHSLASVIEHSALLTHNDAARHWAGDHGDAGAIGRPDRVRAALDRFALADGDYIDVHAWQFTPDSFRRIMNDLAELGLNPLDPIAVYDTPHGGIEFCALLQLWRPARRVSRQEHDIDILFLQTADPFRYSRLLDVTAPNVIEFCRRHGHRYESYVGIKRGWWNWQATYNRIPMLHDLLARGFTGWAVYLDADAYINDLDFDLPTYLAEHSDRAAIFATSGVTGEHWDINAGVAMINFAHPEGRRLVEQWAADFALVSDERLKTASTWTDGDNDQDLIQAIFRRDSALAGTVHVESMDLLNSRHARFIRQHLRAQTGEFGDRVQRIAAEIHDIFAQDGRSAPEHGHVLDERGRFSLLHPVRGQVRLVTAVDAQLRPELAELAISAWQTSPSGALPDYQRPFADALRRNDVDEVASELARLGRSPIAQGILGGARQHHRAERDPAFAYRRARRTYDALVSLAEITQAIAVENPDLGSWGQNSGLSAEHLMNAAGKALGIDLAPPSHIGGYLGVGAGGLTVLHLRMIEAAHSAWRLRQTLDLIGGTRATEVGGGAGLIAWYARRFGIVLPCITNEGVLRAIQAYVLGDSGEAQFGGFETFGRDGRDADLILIDDGFAELPRSLGMDFLRRARDTKATALLVIGQEGIPPAEPEKPNLPTMVKQASGYRLVQRQRHALRPGFVESLYVRE